MKVASKDLIIQSLENETDPRRRELMLTAMEGKVDQDFLDEQRRKLGAPLGDEGSISCGRASGKVGFKSDDRIGSHYRRCDQVGLKPERHIAIQSADPADPHGSTPTIDTHMPK